MVKNIKVTNKYAIKLERAKIHHFALANRWILVIQFALLLSRPLSIQSIMMPRW